MHTDERATNLSDPVLITIILLTIINPSFDARFWFDGKDRSIFVLLPVPVPVPGLGSGLVSSFTQEVSTDGITTRVIPPIVILRTTSLLFIPELFGFIFKIEYSYKVESKEYDSALPSALRIGKNCFVKQSGIVTE